MACSCRRENAVAITTQDLPQELELLDEEANVYKLIGPALIKQDPVEAKSNVQKRLEFIGHELGRLESQLKQIEEKGLQKQNQARMQRYDEQLMLAPDMHFFQHSSR